MTCNTACRLRIDFYPRPPRGGRRGKRIQQAAGRTISIHALLAEGDVLLRPAAREARDFYPRPPRGGRLGPDRRQLPPQKISIHALLAEGDTASRPTGAPAGQFLSTPSSRRATAKTARKHPAFVSLYTSLHKLQRDVCKPNRKITPLLAQTAGIPVRSVPENHVCCRFALAGHQKISTLSWANSGCSPTCATLVW